jgi:hypothetical protein
LVFEAAVSEKSNERRPIVGGQMRIQEGIKVISEEVLEKALV